MKQISGELVATDRIMQRWAVSVGSGLPTDVWDDNPKSRPPPLDDDTAVKVDRIVQHLRPRDRKLAHLWYRTPDMTVVEVAQRMGLASRTSIYPHVNGLLQLLRELLQRVGVAC
jgi:hypothetical protein